MTMIWWLVHVISIKVESADGLQAVKVLAFMVPDSPAPSLKIRSPIRSVGSS